MFVNKVPKLDIPSYSIHVDNGVHRVFTGMAAGSHWDDLAPPIFDLP
jgi:hypothetical protein